MKEKQTKAKPLPPVSEPFCRFLFFALSMVFVFSRALTTYGQAPRRVKTDRCLAVCSFQII